MKHSHPTCIRSLSLYPPVVGIGTIHRRTAFRSHFNKTFVYIYIYIRQKIDDISNATFIMIIAVTIMNWVAHLLYIVRCHLGALLASRRRNEKSMLSFRSRISRSPNWPLQYRIVYNIMPSICVRTGCVIEIASGKREQLKEIVK